MFICVGSRYFESNHLSASTFYMFHFRNLVSLFGANTIDSYLENEAIANLLAKAESD